MKHPEKKKVGGAEGAFSESSTSRIRMSDLCSDHKCDFFEDHLRFSLKEELKMSTSYSSSMGLR